MSDLTCARVRERLDYDPETGILTWRAKPPVTGEARRWNIRYAGKPAGHVSNGKRSGYLIVKLDDRLYLAHRLAWLHQTGSWPVAEIDHRDRNKTNNRWGNLREATHRQNGSNSPNVLHARGVRHLGRKWEARISGRSLGSFDTSEAAEAAYRDAASFDHGEFMPR